MLSWDPNSIFSCSVEILLIILNVVPLCEVFPVQTETTREVEYVSKHPYVLPETTEYGEYTTKENNKSIGNDNAEYIRLFGGTRVWGVVQIRNVHQWNSICAEEFDDIDARVLCKELGLTNGIPVPPPTDIELSGCINLRLKCNGTEAGLAECRHEQQEMLKPVQKLPAAVNCEYSFMSTTENDSNSSLRTTTKKTSDDADDSNIAIAIAVPAQLVLFSVVGFCIYKTVKRYSHSLFRSVIGEGEIKVQWDSDSDDSDFGTIGSSHHHRHFHITRNKINSDTDHSRPSHAHRYKHDIGHNQSIDTDHKQSSIDNASFDKKNIGRNDNILTVIEQTTSSISG